MMRFANRMTAFAATTVLLPSLGAAQEENLDITMIIYTDASVEFWTPLIQGAQDAAAAQGVTLDIQYGDSDPVKQNTLIEAAVANQVDGIAVALYDDEAFDESVCAAVEGGIPVVAFNVDDSQGAEGNCRSAFMGQDFVESGYLIASRLIEEHDIGEGDHVYAPVELPEAVYAQLRYEGVKRALDEVGATSEVVGTGFNLSEALTTHVQYLLGRPETAGIVALGSVPLTTAPQAIGEAGLDIPIAGFDLTPEIIDGIEGGTITATVDQQPYSQGFYAITQLALLARYGLYPSDMNTGGSGLVDATNVAVVRELIGTYR
jgi:simple sugar transport system substrate-binding protein